MRAPDGDKNKYLADRIPIMSTEWTLSLFGDKTGLVGWPLTIGQASMPVWPKSTAYSRHQTESHLKRKIKVFLDRGICKLSKVLHSRIRKLTLGLRLYGLGAFSTQRLCRLWTWIRTFDTLVNLETYIWYTGEPGYVHLIHLWTLQRTFDTLVNLDKYIHMTVHCWTWIHTFDTHWCH